MKWFDTDYVQSWLKRYTDVGKRAIRTDRSECISVPSKILNPVRKSSLPWLQSQWIVDFALSIENTMTFSEKFEHRYWAYFEEHKCYGHMVLVAYHRISIQKTWELKSDLDQWINRLSQSIAKCNFSAETMITFWCHTHKKQA